MRAELEALRQAGISVFSVAVSNRADEAQTRSISSWPQLRNTNYFLSPSIRDLTSISEPLADQVYYAHYLARVANLPTGLYILPSVISSFLNFRQIISGSILDRFS